jgi:hypothetical protein
MGNLIIPNKATIRLLDERDQPVRLANIIFTVHLYARRKNDFDLGPYLSDDTGVITIMGVDSGVGDVHENMKIILNFIFSCTSPLYTDLPDPITPYMVR